jgi:hypothetical protein
MRASAMGYAGVGGVNASLGSRGIMTGPIHTLARKIKAEVLPGIVSGKTGGALAMTEPSGGSDLSRMKTKARGWRGLADQWREDLHHRRDESELVRGRRAHGRRGLWRHLAVSRARRGAGLHPHRHHQQDGLVASDTATLAF